ncbi:unnamed protein product [Phytophthora fragariaefolia]|uniref:Unnamed protein product n=1 Tax=Phytophthora fragariaefolia TaxID=1490495 RepID=A0A9W6Y8D8_9STRA|nr:unnamed protein product [Phytophthora fragariaefolia]
MVFARRSGRLDLPAPAVPGTRKAVRGPVGKQVSYAVICQSPPFAATRTPMPTTTSTDMEVDAVLADAAAPRDASATPGAQPELSVTHSVQVATATTVVASTSDATEQAGGVGVAIPDGTDQVSLRRRGMVGSTTPNTTTHTVVGQATALDNTEQGGVANNAIPDSPDKRVNHSDVEEAKSETDEPPNPCEGFVDLDVFDSDNFMEGLRKERLFGPTPEDDVNVVATADLSDCESDADNEDVMADSAVALDGVDALEDVEMNEEDLNTGMFDLTDDDLRSIAESGWVVYDKEHSVDAATDYYDGQCGPTRSAVAYADSPLGMFFYFLPKELWIRIAEETDRYRRQNISAMAYSRREKLLARQAKDPRMGVPNLEGIEADLNKFKPIQAHEIVHAVALLFGRAVAPIRDGLTHHWCTDKYGAIPRGAFSRFMKRGRFEAIMKFLHFNDNEGDGVHVDKAWKIRPVLQAVEKTFRRGYRLGKVISFDEGMIPNRSKFNPMGIFMPDKPSKYDTKFYMTCCPDTAY